MAAGKAAGKAEGKAEGMLAILLPLLTKRFGAIPSNVVRRLRAARPTDLARWTDRILDAKTLADVFARQPGMRTRSPSVRAAERDRG